MLNDLIVLFHNNLLRHKSYYVVITLLEKWVIITQISNTFENVLYYVREKKARKCNFGENWRPLLPLNV